ESAHMVLWAMSDRAIPRSYRTMEGFGVNTFRFINEHGEAHFVKFHWKPLLGMQSVVWEEATKINGKDPDFHKRDLYENIEAGNFPQYELCVQLIKQEDEFKFDFDILDPTKLWPEEQIPLTKLGVMTLNRNVSNFFAETEQVAFHPGHVVPGVDFSNDPLLQGRLFSYTDTQLIRLGGPNFHEIPINRSVCPFHNNQRDGFMRQTINTGRVAYHKNGLQNNTPHEVPVEEGGYAHYEERIEGKKIRARSSSFEDHFSQAILFWNSQTEVEKEHIIDAFSFELSKVETVEIRQLIVNMFANVSRELSDKVAENVGVNKAPESVNPVSVRGESPALSIYKNIKPGVETKKVGLIATPNTSIKTLVQSFEEKGITVEVISDKLGQIDGIEVKHTLDSAYPVLFDSIYVASVSQDPLTKRKVDIYMDEIYNHYKTLGAEDTSLIKAEYVGHEGVVTGAKEFLEAFLIGRHFNRPLAIG
ncbi:MAG: catalase, partial [Lysinibacillus sp.]